MRNGRAGRVYRIRIVNMFGTTERRSFWIWIIWIIWDFSIIAIIIGDLFITPDSFLDSYCTTVLSTYRLSTFSTSAVDSGVLSQVARSKPKTLFRVGMRPFLRSAAFASSDLVRFLGFLWIPWRSSGMVRIGCSKKAVWR